MSHHLGGPSAPTGVNWGITVEVGCLKRDGMVSAWQLASCLAITRPSCAWQWLGRIRDPCPRHDSLAQRERSETLRDSCSEADVACLCGILDLVGPKPAAGAISELVGRLGILQPGRTILRSRLVADRILRGVHAAWIHCGGIARAPEYH